MPLLRNLLYRFMQAATEPMVWRVERFKKACENPESIQTELLMRILARQADTGFGEDHGFRSVRTIADYRKQVAVAPYERLAPYIERMKAGDTRALIADDRLLLFALTSGTTAARKFIPITTRYLEAYRRGWSMWGIRAFRDHRARRLGLRPILQMAGDPDEFRTPAGTPCGNLSGFTATAQKRMVRKLYCVPPIVGAISDPLARYYCALRFSVPLNVSLFLSANPSTMLLLARTLEQNAQKLIQDIHNGTLRSDLDLPQEIRAALSTRLKPNPVKARELQAIADAHGTLLPKHVWPSSVTLMGTWTGGSMGPYLRQVPHYFGDIPVRDLGLLASEGRMTIPFENNTASGVLDIASHYFEFIPEHEEGSTNPTVLGAHELAIGSSYFIVPTTAAGLYRYHISDLVRVTGFLGKTPMVEFLGKGHRFANLTGEKLSEHHVTQAMEEATRSTGTAVRAYSVAPIWHDVQPYYGLFIEEADAENVAAIQHFLQVFDAALVKWNTEYDAKRSGGRLGAMRAEVLPNGTWAQWDRERLQRTGGSPEQYKRPCLIGDLQFRASMPVLREI